MIDSLRIRNWDKWQSYRKDRGQPPWIKIHRCVMRNPEWVSLTDAQRGQLVAIWLLAADRDGVIPASPEVVRKLCHMDSLPDLNMFIQLDFLDAKPTPKRRKMTPVSRQYDAPETETETETETEKKEDAPNGASSKVYFFESGVIRLSERDFQKWRESFSNLDLRGELIGLTQWAGQQKDWFFAVSGALAKRNREIGITMKTQPQRQAARVII